MRLFVVASIVCAFAIALSGQTNQASLDARRAQLRDALQAEWEYTLRTYPEFATYVGDTRYNDRLGDYSPEAVAKQVEHAKQQLKIFEAIDTTGFPETEVLNQQLMVRELRQDIDGSKFNDWEMPVDQFNGAHLGLASHAHADALHQREGLRELHRALAPDSARARSGDRQHEARLAAII